MYAHRYVMAEHLGRSLVPGEMVLHRCDNPPCTFVEHLFLGTQADNIADMHAKGRGYVPAARRGSDNCRTRLTDDQVRSIRAARGTKISRLVAVDYGVSSGTIRAIWSGTSRAYVT